MQIENKKNRLIIYSLAFVILLMSLWIKMDGSPYFWGKYLWAEDGNLFLNQANELGLQAVITPYQGYLHLFSRLITQLATYFDLLYQPTILSLGWVLAACILVHSFLQIDPERNKIALLFIPLLFLQPEWGEVFFNLTNSQWLLGAALCIYALTTQNHQQNHAKSIAKGFFLFILSLSGPFSILLSPVLVLKIFLLKDFKQNFNVYITVFLGAVIQIMVLLTSSRESVSSFNDFSDGIFSFLAMLFFSANNVYVAFVALVIWILIFALFYDNIKAMKKLEKNTATALLFILTSCILITASLISSTSAVVKEGLGNRYTWIPQILVLTSIFILIKKQKIIGLILMVCISFVWYQQFNPKRYSSLQFESFLEFSRVTEVFIPIQPLTYAFHPKTAPIPGWYIYQNPKNPLSPLEKKQINLATITAEKANLKLTEQGLQIEIKDINPALIFNDKLTCQQSKHVGLNIDMERKGHNPMALAWSKTIDFSEVGELKRWYQQGRIKAQFAFPIDSDGIYVKFYPSAAIQTVTIHKIEVFCLP